MDSVTTNYTLDLVSGLTQVLSDGTTTYLYGISRISQQAGSSTEYFLGDALDSVRQVTDASGEITLARIYEPFGEVMNAAGSGASVYGFTGEWTDITGLVNLRARYYAPWQGRFVSKDVWEGDYYRPASYNVWLYAYSNPVNMSDPSGNIPLPWDIGKKVIYSCNCGWIDFSHAGSGLAKNVFDLLHQEKIQKWPTNGKDNIFAISPKTDAWGVGDVSITVVVRRNIDRMTRESVALGIYRALEEHMEEKQGESWIAKSSYYSFEDLTSDEIGYYLALRYNERLNYKTAIDPRQSEGKNEDAWKWLAGVCGFSEDRKISKEESKEVYEAYGSWLGMRSLARVVKKWGSPLLCEVGNLCDDEPQQWPAEFMAVTPTSEQRGGIWWFYDRYRDGSLIDSNTYKGFHFLK